MSIRKEFIFEIDWPKFALDSDECTQVFSIYAAYPTFQYAVKVKPNEFASTDEQQELAIAKLKVELIKQIACAEFVVKEERLRK